MVALSVAALDMFNPLTVSLLERIREVGLMKAMGMKSSVVVFLSLLVGIGTGIYPAKRATKISALNALRYE